MKKLIAILLSTLMVFSFAALAEESDRTPAEYTFELSGEDKYIENLIFNENVVISGDGSAHIFFVNCQFNGDIINTCDAGTSVFLLGSEVNGNCIFHNTVTEATLEDSFPKFLTDAPINAITENCFGVVIAMGDFSIILDDENYDIASAPWFMDPEAGLVPFGDQEANLYWVASWMENGETQIKHAVEFDPTV